MVATILAWKAGLMTWSLAVCTGLVDLAEARRRSWAATQTQRTGWLAGLGEERISRALSAMHADPFRRWTVKELAGVALMSRSIFAQRFAATVGEPPLHYLARWRLNIAADRKGDGGDRQRMRRRCPCHTAKNRCTVVLR